MGKARHTPIGLLLVVLSMAGCAGAPQTKQLFERPAQHFPVVELKGTPFFPQERFQCGPAALATVLTAGGASVSPDSLTSQVYIPGREGSLQLEMVAATRRQGYVPYILAPTLNDLLAEVQAGNPVLVLQNLALSWYPRWHYAVVIGYDLPAREIVLRSGTERRHVISIDRFEHTWARSKYWAMVTLPPGRLPATAAELKYLKSVADLESLGDMKVAHTAYATAIARWPASTLAWMGFGNTAYAINRHSAAEAAFRRVLELTPNYAPALNNLAQLLSERDELAEAETLARRALEADSARASIYERTLSEIRARRKDPSQDRAKP